MPVVRIGFKFMQLFCPVCQAAFPGVQRCPRCGGLLLMSHEVSPESTRPVNSEVRHYQPNAWSRVAIGVVLALGVYVAIRKLVMGTVLVLLDDPRAWWMSFNGLTAVYTAQAIAVVCGSLIAGSGRSRGFGYGLGVGLVCGGLFLGFELLLGVSPNALVIYLQPLMLALLGIVAGVVGARVWGVAPVLDIPVPNPSKLSSIQFAKQATVDAGKPTLWVRVIASAAIMVLGVAAAEHIKLSAQKYSGGLLHVQSMGQGEFITWQLATFTVLLGGMFAGAGTGAGLRHGLYSGALGGLGVLLICFKQGIIPPIAYWLERLNLDDLSIFSPGTFVAITGSIVMVGVIGGWLGGAMFLPLAPLQMRRRLRLGGD